jgi:hypothetical protein
VVSMRSLTLLLRALRARSREPDAYDLSARYRAGVFGAGEPR